MSALNVILEPDRVHVITDGAGVNEQGRVGFHVQKVVPIAHLRLVLALRGTTAVLAGLSALFDRGLATNFDQLRDRIGDHLRSIIGEAIKQPDAEPFDLVVAGWSDRARAPAAFMVDSHGGHPGTPAPLMPWDLDLALMTPTSPALAARFNPILLAGGYDIDAVAADIVAHQRGILVPHKQAGDIHMVGGFAQLTTVTRREITTKIVCRWEEDRVGEKLGTRFTKLRRVFGFGAAA